MSDASRPARPRQVSLAAGTTIVASLVVVLTAFDRVAGLYSLETREALAKFVADQPAGMTLTVDDIVTTLRVLTMVAAACAAAAAVLAVFALRRNTAARTALTVVAVPLFLTGLATGAVASSVAAAAAVSLWFEPSRTWFRGGAPGGPEATAPSASPSGRAAAPPTPPPAAPPAAPPPYQGAYGAPAGAPTPTITRPPAPGWPTEHPVRPPRPRAVALACVLTWVASGLTAVFMVITGVVLATDPDYVLQRAHEQNPELQAQGVTDGMLIAVTLVMVGAVVLWCLGAALLGVLVLRGTEWARMLLVVSAGISAALSLLATALGAFPLVLTLAASSATLALLVRTDVRPFFLRR